MPDDPAPPGCRYIDMKNVTGSRSYCDDEAAGRIFEVMKNEPHGSIHYIDTGSYHYLTWFFLHEVQPGNAGGGIVHEVQSDNVDGGIVHEVQPGNAGGGFVLVVFDNHTDMQPPAFEGLLSCGGWIIRALQDIPSLCGALVIGPDEEAIAAADESAAQKVRFLSRERLAAWRSADSFNENFCGSFEKWVRKELADLRQKYGASAVYLSVDKDILSEEYARTSWSQGETSNEELAFMVRSVLHASQDYGMSFTGADVCGESEPEDTYGCTLGRKTNLMLHRLFTEFCISASGPAQS